MFYLRFEQKYTENKAILTYHLLQLIAYLSAYVNGCIAMQSITAGLIMLLILYLMSACALAAAFLMFEPGDVAMPFVLMLFGLGHGALKSVIHRMLKTDVIGISFAIMSACLLVIQVGVVYYLPMNGTLENAKLVMLGLLVVVVIFLFLSVFGSLFDNHKHHEDDYKLSDIVAATYYGFMYIVMDAEEKAKKVTQHKKPKREIQIMEKWENLRDDRVHWMKKAKQVYPAEFISDLIQKFRVHKFYLAIAGVWVAVEMKFSYWIFVTYLSDRVLDKNHETVIHPPQYLAITPAVLVLFAPLFYLYVKPMLAKSFYHTSLRQMCLGAFFMVVAVGISWRIAAFQSELSTEFMEADYR